MNVLKPNLRIAIQTLLDAGKSQREISNGCSGWIARRSDGSSGRQNPPGWPPGIDAEKAAETAETSEQNPPPRPPAPKPPVTPSACEIHREWIEGQVALGRNAMSIYQDLGERFGFTHRYNSVKRFVAALKAREPERFDVLDALPGEEAQVDFGLGAPTRAGERQISPTVSVRDDAQVLRQELSQGGVEGRSGNWARLHEEAFRTFGGSVAYVVLDNLKQGVIEPDLYAPLYNPLYAAMLAHYGAVADAARVVDPNRKGTVENAIQHTQSTALKGRKFDSIEEQNTWLAHWEERWAAPRIHGRKKRQVLAMFAEEKPALKASAGDALPLLPRNLPHRR